MTFRRAPMVNHTRKNRNSRILDRAIIYCIFAHDVAKGSMMFIEFVEFPIFIVLLQLFFPKLKLGTVRIPQRYTYMYAQPVHGSLKFNSTPS